MIVSNVSTVLKDIKVTKKGINLTLEDVRLQGEQLKHLAALIGEVVQVGVDIPQMSLFEENKAESNEERVLTFGEPDPHTLTDNEVADQLGLT